MTFWRYSPQGAYNFTMASNYNRLCRPALVMSGGGPRPGWRSAGRPLRTWVACDL